MQACWGHSKSFQIILIYNPVNNNRVKQMVGGKRIFNPALKSNSRDFLIKSQRDHRMHDSLQLLGDSIYIKIAHALCDL